MINSHLNTTTHHLLNHFMTKDVLSSNRLSEYLIGMIADQISESYKNLSQKNISEYTKKNIREKEPPAIAISAKPFDSTRDCRHAFAAERLQTIQHLFGDIAQQWLHSVFLHGSYGDNSAIPGWSDVDILVVISQQAATDSRALLQLRERFAAIHQQMYEIDPLQHHGLQIITEIDLKHYAPTFLPPQAITHAKSLCFNSRITFHQAHHVCAKSATEKLLHTIKSAIDSGEMKTHAYQERYLSTTPLQHDGMYQLKYFIDINLLFPCHYLNDIGIACHKKDSFEKIQSRLPEQTLEWLDTLQAIRRDWGGTEGFDYQPNMIPEWVKSRLNGNYFEQCYQALLAATHADDYRQQRHDQANADKTFN